MYYSRVNFTDRDESTTDLSVEMIEPNKWKGIEMITNKFTGNITIVLL